MNIQAFLCVSLCFVSFVGCGHRNPSGRVPVSGRITLDGKVLGNGNIRFLPQQSGGVQTGAVINSSGDYRIEKLQGLPPGKYLVQIYSNDKSKGAAPPANTADGFPPPSIERLPAKYNVDTMLTAEVVPSSPARFDFDLKTK